MGSPLEIMIGLHYWTTPSEYAADNYEHQNSGAIRTILAWFVRDGLLERLSEPNEHGGTYRATEALGVWVEALCAVPFPVQRWIVPPPARAALRAVVGEQTETGDNDSQAIG